MVDKKITPQEFISLLQKLLSEGIPAADFVALGGAITMMKPGDWKSVAGNVFIKDMKPIYHSGKAKIISLKELKKNIKYEGSSSFFKNIAKKSKSLIKGSIQNATVSIPEAKNRLSKFSSKIMGDYNQLKSSEDRGRYILKLSLYAGIFAMAFQKGAKQKMLSKSTLPLIAVGLTLVFINRILEQAESKLVKAPGALKLSEDLRSLLRTLNMGFSSGMTFNVMVDGIVDQKIEISDIDGKTIGSLMPKSIIDSMIYSTLMGLFSSEEKS
ncbi:MAG: hypothetical protein H7336_04095 [Bacteriovorax sp.]|nr:hypothetical protein [Bacteriovorax sp.]